jgi:hypothetical protein
VEALHLGAAGAGGTRQSLPVSKRGALWENRVLGKLCVREALYREEFEPRRGQGRPQAAQRLVHRLWPRPNLLQQRHDLVSTLSPCIFSGSFSHSRERDDIELLRKGGGRRPDVGGVGGKGSGVVGAYAIRGDFTSLQSDLARKRCHDLLGGLRAVPGAAARPQDGRRLGQQDVGAVVPQDVRVLLALCAGHPRQFGGPNAHG